MCPLTSLRTPALTVLQSFSRTPSTMVGAHLDQKITPSIPCAVRGLLFYRSRPVCVLVEPGERCTPFLMWARLTDHE